MLLLATGGFLALAVTLTTLVTAKYRSLFHPLSMPVLNLVVMAALAPLARSAVLGDAVPESCQVQASLMTSLYVLGLALPLLAKANPLLPLGRQLARPLEVRPRLEARGIYLLIAAGLVAGFVAGYALLLRDSRAGWDWLRDPRHSYLIGREGVGHWYVSAQACLFLAFLTLLYFVRLRRVEVIAALALSTAFLFVFFGSKHSVIGVLVATAVYYNFYVRRIPPAAVCLAALAVVPLVLLSPLLQGNFDSLRGTLSYYDYFENSARYLSKADEIGRMHGGAAVSSLWAFVPRGLYPDKPFIYGSLYINEFFWPGVAEKGHTPALLPWTVYYLDFGPLGVLAGGLWTGLVSKAVYLYFLRSRSLIAWLAYLHVCFVPILKHSPLVYFGILLLLLALAIRTAVYVLMTVASTPRTHGQIGISPSEESAPAILSPLVT